jgi:hypothetical protein
MLEVRLSSRKQLRPDQKTQFVHALAAANEVHKIKTREYGFSR